MPSEAHAPMAFPKLSETSKEPVLLDIDASCFWKSGFDTPTTVMLSWLALNWLTIFWSAAASDPVHRYEKVIVVRLVDALAAPPDSATVATSTAAAAREVTPRWTDLPFRYCNCMLSTSWSCPPLRGGLSKIVLPNLGTVKSDIADKTDRLPKSCIPIMAE